MSIVGFLFIRESYRIKVSRIKVRLITIVLFLLLVNDFLIS